MLQYSILIVCDGSTRQGKYNELLPCRGSVMSSIMQAFLAAILNFPPNPYLSKKRKLKVFLPRVVEYDINKPIAAFFEAFFYFFTKIKDGKQVYILKNGLTLL